MKTGLFAKSGLGSQHLVSTDYIALEYRLRTNMQKLDPVYQRMQKSASRLKKDSCQRCGACCYKAPCKVKNLTNLTQVASYLNLTVSDCIKKYFTVDTSLYGDFLVPIRKGQEDLAGKIISNAGSYDEGPCVFYSENSEGLGSCILQGNKPEQGKLYLCSSKDKVDTSEYVWERDELRKLGFEFEEQTEEEW